MSNAAVGPVYDTIISEVINAVRVDFEENGVDDGVLEELKKKWQHKLSQTKLAQFPWDPKPEPQPTPAASNGSASTAPANAAPSAPSFTQSTLSPQASAQTLSLPGQLMPNSNGVTIKQDPGIAAQEPAIKQEPGVPSILPAYNPANTARGTAAQRAAQALESQYGQRAAASINAIHSGMASQMQMTPGAQVQQGPRPGQVPQQLNPQQQYRQGVAAAMQQRLQQQVGAHQGPSNGLPASQMDGAADGPEAPALRRVSEADRPTDMSRAEIDNLLHTQLAARAKQMEGGGLLLPLKDASKRRSMPVSRQDAGGPAQFDGPDDGIKSEDEDEDAINSDLDDPEDDNDEEEDEDESMGHMMLCMYDKVQRVKNKWKCILKDGVLTVNGKEYVFHKATGEYEW